MISKKIIKLLRNNSFIDQNDIAKILNITVDGVKYNMRKLKNKDYIKRLVVTMLAIEKY